MRYEADGQLVARGDAEMRPGAMRLGAMRPGAGLGPAEDAVSRPPREPRRLLAPLGLRAGWVLGVVYNG
ncbi:hypothetical protein ABZX93_19990 [Streptomyces sp. NPDC006632]|uniref:hypothetical protein n=1 Tax=Streptomyces sp. NPDC006632 TaxID=3157182 RepID=UPI0033A591D1